MSDNKPIDPTNSRAIRRRTDRALVVAVVLILVIVGGALIYLIWGLAAFVTGMPCLLGAAAVITVLWLFFALIDRFLGEE